MHASEEYPQFTVHEIMFSPLCQCLMLLPLFHSMLNHQLLGFCQCSFCLPANWNDSPLGEVDIYLI